MIVLPTSSTRVRGLGWYTQVQEKGLLFQIIIMTMFFVDKLRAHIPLVVGLFGAYECLFFVASVSLYAF